jgi:hypothetical protein
MHLQASTKTAPAHLFQHARVSFHHHYFEIALYACPLGLPKKNQTAKSTIASVLTFVKYNFHSTAENLELILLTIALLGVAIESCHWFYPDSNLRSFGTLEE